MNIVKNNYMGGGKNKGIILLKFIAAFLITYSHMGILFPKYGSLVTGGAIGDGLSAVAGDSGQGVEEGGRAETA